MSDVSDMNKTFQAILNILQDIFVNEASIQRVFNMAVNPSTVLVGLWLLLTYLSFSYMTVADLLLKPICSTLRAYSYGTVVGMQPT